MEETTFNIVLNIKTADGFESYGKFFLGNDRDAAYAVFEKLIGSSEVTEKSVLTLELMEISHGLPVNVQLINCTLEQLAENCKIITKETFKLVNLKEF